MSSIKNALHLAHSVITPYLSWLVILLYLFLTLPALLDADHMLKNLEPYPDGLLYALASKQAATDGRLALVYNGTELEYWVPPLYSIVLLPFYIVFNHTEVFYVANVIIGVASVMTLQRLLRFLTHSSLIASFGTLLFVLHGYVLWLPSLPMAENLQLLLSLIALYVLLVPEKMNFKWLLLLSIASASLVLTKYVAVSTGLMFILLGIYRARNTLRTFHWCLLGVFAAVGYGLFWYVVQNPYVLLVSFISAVVFGDNQYISSHYFLSNLEAYMNATVLEGAFLWMRHPLTSLVVFFTAVSLSFFFLYIKRLTTTHLYLFLLLASTLVVPLFFYVVDSRYILLVVPFFVVLISIQLGQLLKHQKLYIVLLCWSTLLITHLFLQRSLIKQVISANLLGRTTAWQFRAVLDFNRVFSRETEQQPILITALPPHLVSTYQTQNYRVVPLAQTQEFLNKEQYVWGEAIEYDDLKQTYLSWVSEGKPVFISNAYVTHQASVIEAYEEYKTVFAFHSVSSGCEDACAVYRLELVEAQ